MAPRIRENEPTMRFSEQAVARRTISTVDAEANRRIGIGRTLPKLMAVAFSALLVAGCGLFGKDEAPPLPGQRVQVLSPDQSVQPDPSVATLRIALPRPATNSAWPQAGGVILITASGRVFLKSS